MKQFNINIDPDFEAKLKRLMKLRNIPHKSTAIKIAVSEALERAGTKAEDFHSLIGAGLKAPLSKKRPLTEDDLW